MQIKSIVVLIGIASMECLGQVRPNRPQSTSAPVRVARGKSEMDGRSWTILGVSAKGAYRNTFGTLVRPELRLQCVQQKEEHRFLVVLETGPHAETPADFDRLRVKLDDGEPTEEEWLELSDHKSWSHEYYPDETDLKFLKRIIDAKTVLIEFKPFMRASVVEAKFDVSGLRREFYKYPECKQRLVVNGQVEKALAGFGYPIEHDNKIAGNDYLNIMRNLAPFIEECESRGLPRAAALDAFFMAANRP